MVVRELVTRLGFQVDTTNAGRYEQTIKNLQGRTNIAVISMAKTMRMFVVSWFGRGLINAGKNALDLASDLEEASNTIIATYDRMTESALEWTKTAINTYGIAQKDATKWIGTMSAQLKASGFSEEQFHDMSQKIVGLAGDLASFYNISQEDAMEKLRSGLSGTIMPLRQLGIDMSATTLNEYALSQGIRKGTKDMTQYEKVLLRYNYIMQVTKDQQGDFARTLETSLENYRRVLKQNVVQVTTDLFKPALPYAIRFVRLMKQAIDSTREWIKVSSDKIESFWQKVYAKIRHIIVSVDWWFFQLEKKLNGFQGFRNLFESLGKNIEPIIIALAKVAEIKIEIFDAIANAISKLLDLTAEHPKLVEFLVYTIVALKTLKSVGSILNALGFILGGRKFMGLGGAGAGAGGTVVAGAGGGSALGTGIKATAIAGLGAITVGGVTEMLRRDDPEKFDESKFGSWWNNLLEKAPDFIKKVVFKLRKPNELDESMFDTSKFTPEDWAWFNRQNELARTPYQGSININSSPVVNITVPPGTKENLVQEISTEVRDVMSTVFNEMINKVGSQIPVTEMGGI